MGQKLPMSFSFRAAILIAVLATAKLAGAAPAAIKEGACDAHGARIILSDGSKKEFPAVQGYKCSDFQISADHRFAGWKTSGELVVESGGQKQTYPDATLYVFVDGKSYAVTENSRFILH